MDKATRELQELRKKIDAVDGKILKNLKERHRLVVKIGRLKEKKGLPVFQKARWEAMLSDYIKRGRKLNINEKFVEALMKLIHKESVKIQRTNRSEVKK